MTFDDDGQLHLSGDMHNVPLIYFRTTKPGDISSFEQVKSMVGKNENSCTYPMFLRGASNELIFTYRDGASGRGAQIYDVYDQSSHQWRRLLDQPLTDGRGKMSAYLQGPVRGSDGYFHLVWVWRDSPDCSTNHDLSYARSKDLVHWETSAGKPVELPMTIDNAEVIDPVPVRGGMVNGNTQIGFDADKRVIVSYHKYDAAGNTQIYNARYEGDHWKIYQTTDWKYRWEFGGGGSIGFDVHVGPAQLQPDGSLAESFSNPKDGGGLWKLDAATLKPIGEKISRPQRPAELDKVESTFPGMQVRWAGDEGTSGEKDVKYWLRWETLGPNRDQPRSPPLPEASMLRVYEIAGGE